MTMMMTIIRNQRKKRRRMIKVPIFDVYIGQKVSRCYVRGFCFSCISSQLFDTQRAQRLGHLEACVTTEIPMRISMYVLDHSMNCCKLGKDVWEHAAPIHFILLVGLRSVAQRLPHCFPE